MEEEEYNDIQDQKYPQNAETSNVNSLIYKYHHSILVKKIMKRRGILVKKIMKRRVKIKCCVLLNQSD